MVDDGTSGYKKGIQTDFGKICFSLSSEINLSEETKSAV